jgi:hypothetical protein
MSTNSWQTTDLRIDSMLKESPARGRPNCNTVPTCKPALCCVLGVEKIVEWLLEVNADQKNYFAVWFYITGITISWTRELIRCPEQDPENPVEPLCRYVMKLVGTGYYTARVNSNYESSYTVTNTYLHPCFVLCEENLGVNFDCYVPVGTFSGERCEHPEYACSADLSLYDPFCDLKCENTRNPANEDDCHVDSNFFCWERIRYFTEAPDGTINFSDADIIENDPFDPTQSCDEPVCKKDCSNLLENFGYINQIVVNQPEFSPPFWCDDSPTIETDVTNYTIDYRVCPDKAGSVYIEECDPALIIIFDSIPCTDCCDDPITATTSIDRIVLPNWEENSEICRFASATPTSFCNQFGTYFPDPIGIRYPLPIPPGQIEFDPFGHPCGMADSYVPNPFGARHPQLTGIDPCEPSECWTTLYCPEDCFFGCEQKNVGSMFTEELTTTIAVQCSEVDTSPCTFNIPEIDIEIEIE